MNDYDKEVHLVNVSSNGHQIEVIITKPKVVKASNINGSIFLIHGVAGQAQEWRHQTSYFVEKQWNVISINLIGHGGSSKPKNNKDYEFRQLAADATFVFDRFAGYGQRVIVGHSYGCSIATYLTVERMDQIHRLVLISGGSPTPLGDPPFLFSMCDCFLGCFHRIIIFEFRKRAFYQNKSSITSLLEDKKVAIDINSQTLKYIMLGQIWDEGGEDYHSKILIPTLLIHGLQDKFVSEEEEYEMLSTLPVATLRTVKDAGHMVMLEKPALVNKFIEEHLLRDFTTSSSLTFDNNNSCRRKSKQRIENKKTLPNGYQSKLTIHIDTNLNFIRNKVYPKI